MHEDRGSGHRSTAIAINGLSGKYHMRRKKKTWTVSVGQQPKGEIWLNSRGRFTWLRANNSRESYAPGVTMDVVVDHIARVCRVNPEKVVTRLTLRSPAA
jgi:hypothetical protein